MPLLHGRDAKHKGMYRNRVRKSVVRKSVAEQRRPPPPLAPIPVMLKVENAMPI
jgi:hypothetical protein